jgi:2-phosphosulfolactate phosphatase
MNVLFYPLVEQAGRDGLQDVHAVIIDVLRLGSTVVAALASGARKIIPAKDIETASRLARPPGQPAKVLAGERKGVRIGGFDLGNSPLEYTIEAVGGKTIILTTTNGTRGIDAVSKARRIVLCAINNVDAVSRSVRNAAVLAIVCCGTEGRVAAEDMLCGGMLLETLGDRICTEKLNDTARLALLVARETGDTIEPFLRGCDSGKKLIELGYGADVDHCARRDISAIVPEIKDGALRAGG